MSVSLVKSQQFTKILTGSFVNTIGDSRSVNWIDLNKDGWMDCMITNGPFGGQNNFLYINSGSGTFTAVLSDTIVKDGKPSDGATWADADNDGDVDAFVVNYYDVNNLFYLNDGNGNFTQQSTGSLCNDGGYSETASWGDYDNDGLLDLYVANSSGNLKNFLYHNTGSSTFAKINTGSVVNNTHSSRCVNWTDIDLDGDVDLFVTNESNENEDIYENTGNGSFVLHSSGPLLNDGRFTMSGSWADIDNDGDLDVFLANDQAPNSLFRNDGNFVFTKLLNDTVSKGSGHAFSSAWSDIDNDGDLDLFVTYAFAGSSLQQNRLYLNDGAGSFTRIQDVVTADSSWSYGCAFADYDNDGFEDLAVATVRFSGVDPSDFLYHNNGNGNHWLTLACTGTLSNRSAIGTKVKVKSILNGSSVWQMRELSAQSSYCGQNDPRAHFGLGSSTMIDSIRVEWPSGLVQHFTQVTADQFLSLTEGGSLSSVQSIPESLPFSIFPNPTQEILHIDISQMADYHEMKYQLIDSAGKIAAEKTLLSPDISVAAFSPGIYFLRIESQGKNGIQKLIIH
ncbi:MAG: FG-GAP-like repeat-containing protein [Bacteroidia bacterium]